MSMIQTINLTKKYGDLVALDNLNLEIQEGDAFGFIGPNGAGKTTTIKILATLLRPTWGEARIDGMSVGPVHAAEVRRLIGYVPDFFGSYENMLVAEYLSFFAAAYDIPSKRRSGLIDEVLQLTDLLQKADSPVSGLSRGMQQRLSVARVLLHDPKVLLMDEPSSGLDPRARVEMRELLKELHRMRKTILISSHILHELADLCNVVAIIERGKLQFHGTPSELVAKVSEGQHRGVRVSVESGMEQLPQCLEKIEGVLQVRPETDVVHVVLEAGVSPSRIASRLVGDGYRLLRLEEESVSLETAFMRLTKGLVQ